MTTTNTMITVTVTISQEHGKDWSTYPTSAEGNAEILDEARGVAKSRYVQGLGGHDLPTYAVHVDGMPIGTVRAVDYPASRDTVGGWTLEAWLQAAGRPGDLSYRSAWVAGDEPWEHAPPPPAVRS